MHSLKSTAVAGVVKIAEINVATYSPSNRTIPIHAPIFLFFSDKIDTSLLIFNYFYFTNKLFLK